MSLFKTTTPPYRKQRGSRPPENPEGVRGWIWSLFRTGTPAYKTAPPQTAAESSDTATGDRRQL